MTRVQMTKCDWCEASIEVPDELEIDDDDQAEMFEGWLHVHTYDDEPPHDFCSADCVVSFYQTV